MQKLPLVFSRCYSKLPAIKSAKKPETTLYIKGFLSKGEKKEQYDRWLAAHHKLVFKDKWHEHCHTYDWDVGSLKIPAPLASGAGALLAVYNSTKLFRVNPVTFATTLALDTVVLAGAVLYQYFIIEENTNIMAPKLALKLINLSKKYDKVRIVCHSLGCKLLLNAIPYVPLKHRPHTIHLCAPTFNEAEYQDVLTHLSKNRTYIYYTKDDGVLAIALQLTKNKDPVGAFGLKCEYANVEPIDVTDHFKNQYYWTIHNNYHKLFHKFIGQEERKLLLTKREDF